MPQTFSAILTAVFLFIPIGAQETPGSHREILQKSNYEYGSGTNGDSLIKEDCIAKHPNDAYAQCVCNCQNKFIDDIIKCPTEPCIGAASIARTSCIASCSRLD